MANTVSGPYAKTTWIDASTAVNQTHMNNLETGSGVALASFNPDLVTSGFVLSGATATRHNSYYAAVQADSPLRYYRLDDTTSGVIVDSSANAVYGSGSGVPTLGVAGALTGDSDAAMTFAAASSQRVTLPDSGLPAVNAAWSVELWFKVSSLPGSSQVLAGWGTAATSKLASIAIGASGVFTSVFGSQTAARSPSLNTWHHYIATWDGTTLKDYLDGVVGTGVTPGALNITLTGTAAIAVRTDLTLYFSGSLDEVAFYGTALSSTRVTAHYTAGTTATTQVDIASGLAYLIQSDGTLARCTIASTNETTSTHSATYFLDLNPDGSWSWATSHSGVANHITICSVATDGSGNAITVTDARVTSVPLLATTASVTIPGVAQLGGQATTGALGASVTVASITHVIVTLTTLNTYLSYTTTATGFYRASFTCSYQQATSVKILAEVGWHVAPGGSLATASFLALSGTPGMILNGSQATAMGSNQEVACAPISFYALVGTQIFIAYQENGGTPSTFLTAAIERIF